MLYNTDYYIRVCSILIVASVIGAVLNAIPFFFYDLTETKQKAMVQVLKIRAIFNDAEMHILTREKCEEALEIIKDAKRYENAEFITISNEKLINAKRTHKRSEIKKAKSELKEQKIENEKIAVSKFVSEELNKFNTESGKEEIRNAEMIVNAGLDGFLKIEFMTKKQARSLPRNTQQEKTAAKNALTLINKMKTAKKTVKKYYPNGIVKFDDSLFEEIFSELDKNDSDRRNTVLKLKYARESKNRSEIVMLKNELNELHRKKSAIEIKLKQAEEQNSVYHRAAAPYLDALDLIKQKEWYETAESMLTEYAF